MLRLRRRARRDAGVRRLYRWSQHPRRGVRKNIPDPGLHGACARRRQAAHHRRVALLLNISKLEGRLSSSPLPLWERSDRIDRCDPGEGLRTIYRREPLTPTLSHKGRGSSPPPLQVLDSIFKQPTVEPSLRANGSRECAPDDRLHEAIHRAAPRKNGLLRSARNDESVSHPASLSKQQRLLSLLKHTFAISRRISPEVCSEVPALESRGRGECRAPMRPQPRVVGSKHAR